jgi:hypothetical protein
MFTVSNEFSNRDEHGEKIEEEFWMEAELDKLPAYLMIVGRKDSPNKTAGGAAGEPTRR